MAEITQPSLSECTGSETLLRNFSDIKQSLSRFTDFWQYHQKCGRTGFKVTTEVGCNLGGASTD
jgi:hypothetical protein